ncbi:MAG: LacI family transcriptional regulator [Opitutaceae bacterium]|jgi:LacI family transcriptional regulator|nr:LacI family transcriptional regulator [Opitutaceae bacterium]
MSIDQEEIARTLSVSRSTVSRSLSGHPSIHPETRARVLAAAADLGYRMREHNRGRRAAPQRVSTIGVLIATPSFENSPHPEAGQEMLAGLSDAAAARDAMLDTHFVDPDALRSLTDPACRPAGWRSRQWRGAVLIYQHAPEVISSLATDMSVVSLVHQYAAPALDCIDTDPAHGMELLVSRLMAAGHRRIGFVNRVYRGEVQPSWIYARFAGFVQALVKQGQTFLAEATLNVLPGAHFSNEQLIDEVLRIHRQHNVTAFVCGADHQAYHLMRGLTERGVSVPGQISLTGFDGTPVPDGLPKLTTIRSPLRELGVAAFRRLVNRIQDPGQPVRHILHHGRFVDGDTIAPPTVTTG